MIVKHYCLAMPKTTEIGEPNGRFLNKGFQSEVIKWLSKQKFP